MLLVTNNSSWYMTGYSRGQTGGPPDMEDYTVVSDYRQGYEDGRGDWLRPPWDKGEYFGQSAGIPATWCKERRGVSKEEEPEIIIIARECLEDDGSSDFYYYQQAPLGFDPSVDQAFKWDWYSSTWLEYDII